MPETYKIEHLTSIKDEQIKEISNLVLLAFEGDPTFISLMGGNLGFVDEYIAAVLRASLLEGELYVITVQEGGGRKIAAWAAHFPPGNSLFATEAQRALGFNDLMEKYSPEMRDWMINSYKARAEEMISSVFQPDELENIWWCSSLATHPNYQNRGFGTALIRILFTKAQEEGNLAGVLTTVGPNVGKYTSMGFTYRAKTEIPSPFEGFELCVLSRKADSPL